MAAENDPPLPRMSLVDYARFSERCLKSNTRLTPTNCLVKRTDETEMTHAFRLGRTDGPASGTTANN
jgi:hypothetical protein